LPSLSSLIPFKSLSEKDFSNANQNFKDDFNLDLQE
jgi:hypothetical protein